VRNDISVPEYSDILQIPVKCGVDQKYWEIPCHQEVQIETSGRKDF